MAFPSNPMDGQRFTLGDKTYEYEDTDSKWTVVQVELDSDSFVGDNVVITEDSDKVKITVNEIDTGVAGIVPGPSEAQATDIHLFTGTGDWERIDAILTGRNGISVTEGVIRFDNLSITDVQTYSTGAERNADTDTIWHRGDVAIVTDSDYAFGTWIFTGPTDPDTDGTTDADWTKLTSGGANNLSFVRDGESVTVQIETGSNTALPAATSAYAGVMAAEDKVKLDSLTTYTAGEGLVLASDEFYVDTSIIADTDFVKGYVTDNALTGVDSFDAGDNITITANGDRVQIDAAGFDDADYIEINSEGATGASALGADGIAIGDNSQAASADSISIGRGTRVVSPSSVAIGLNSDVNANATGGVAIGFGAEVNNNAEGSISLGSGASSSAANQLTIGGGSGTDYEITSVRIPGFKDTTPKFIQVDTSGNWSLENAGGGTLFTRGFGIDSELYDSDILQVDTDVIADTDWVKANFVSLDTDYLVSATVVDTTLSITRSDGTTVNFAGGGGGGVASITVSETAPLAPADADLWYDSGVNYRTFLYHEESGAWVDIAPAADDSEAIGQYRIKGTSDLEGKIDNAVIKDNAVDADALNVSGDGTSGQVLHSNGDGSFYWASGGGGGGAGSVTISETQPGSPSDGDLWYDSGVNYKIFMYSTAAQAWIDANPASVDTETIGDYVYPDSNNLLDGTIHATVLKASTVGSTHIINKAVGESKLNVDTDGNSGQYLTSNGDGTFTWTTVSGGGGGGSGSRVTVSETTPADAATGDLWYDSGTNYRLFMFDSESAAWVDTNPSSVDSEVVLDITIPASNPLLSGDLNSTALKSNTIDTDKIVSGAVTAAKLAVSGNGTDGQFLSSDGTGGFTWETISSGGGGGSGVSVTISDTPPANSATGDLWYDSNINYRMFVYDSENGSWIDTNPSSVDSDAVLSVAWPASNTILEGTLANTIFKDGSVDSDALAGNSVTASKLAVADNGDSGEVLSSDGDGTFSWIERVGTDDFIQGQNITIVDSDSKIKITANLSDDSVYTGGKGITVTGQVINVSENGITDTELAGPKGSAGQLLTADGDGTFSWTDLVGSNGIDVEDGVISLESLHVSDVKTFTTAANRNADNTTTWHTGDIAILTEDSDTYIYIGPDDSEGPTTDSDWTKFLNNAAGTNLTNTRTSTSVQIHSSSGTSTTLAAANTVAAGVMTAAQHIKLGALPSVFTGTDGVTYSAGNISLTDNGIDTDKFQDNSVRADTLAVDGNGEDGEQLLSNNDGTFRWGYSVPTVTAGSNQINYSNVNATATDTNWVDVSDPHFAYATGSLRIRGRMTATNPTTSMQVRVLRDGATPLATTTITDTDTEFETGNFSITQGDELQVQISVSGGSGTVTLETGWGYGVSTIPNSPPISHFR